MSKQSRPPVRGRAGSVLDVRFMEVEFDAPVGTRMVIELEGGVRLLVADDRAAVKTKPFNIFRFPYGAF